MKIYCGVPFLGVKEYKEYYHKLYEEIMSLGYTHVDKEFLEVDHKEWSRKMKKGKKGHAEHFHTKMKSIQKADVCVFEASFHSTGIGFLIQKTLEEGKPCVVLHLNKQVPIFLSGAKHDKLIVRSYTPKTLKRTLKQALTTAKQRRDKRFNFYLSTKLLEYIETLSKEEGATKSKIMRDMILRDMRDRVGSSMESFF